MPIPEEFSALFRPDDLKALGITGVDLWSLLPDELEALENIQNVEGILETVLNLDDQIGEITAQISNEIAKYIGTGLGAVAGFLLPGIGSILGSLISSFLGGLIGDLFGPDRIPKDKLEEEGLSYHRCVIYIPPGAVKKNRHGLFPPDLRGGTVFSQTHDQSEDETFIFRSLGNVIGSMSEPHIPVARFVRFDDDKPVISTCIGFTREGFALFDEWPGSEFFIGETVEKGGIPYQTAVNAGVPGWGVDRARKHALLARAAGLPGGFHGPPGLPGKIYRLKRRIMATFAGIKQTGVPLRDFIFRFDFWRFVPGFSKVRYTPRGGEAIEGLYVFSLDALRIQVRELFITGSSRESPGKIKWISVGIAALSLLGGIFLFWRRKK